MGIKAYKQLESGTVTRALLDAAIIAELNQIISNANNIQAINDAKGAANGFAPLGADQKVPDSFLSAKSLADTKTVASETEVFSLTTADVQNGDVVVVATGDEATNKSYRVIDDTKLDQPEGYQELLSSINKSLIMRDGSAQNGQVALAEIAFTGAASDINIADLGDLFDATDVEGALVEMKGLVDGSQTEAIAGATLIEGSLAGDQDDSNTAYTISGIDTNKVIFLYRDGIEQISSGFATHSGDNVTAVISAPASDEAIKVFGYPN